MPDLLRTDHRLIGLPLVAPVCPDFEEVFHDATQNPLNYRIFENYLVHLLFENTRSDVSPLVLQAHRVRRVFMKLLPSFRTGVLDDGLLGRFAVSNVHGSLDRPPFFLLARLTGSPRHGADSFVDPWFECMGIPLGSLDESSVVPDIVLWNRVRKWIFENAIEPFEESIEVDRMTLPRF